MTHNDIETVLRRFIPANGNEPKPVETANINITARRDVVTAINGGRISRGGYGKWVIYFSIVIVLMLILSQCEIGHNRSRRMKQTVSEIAKCENVSPNVIHADLRSRFNYLTHNGLRLGKYNWIMQSLKNRKEKSCKRA